MPDAMICPHGIVGGYCPDCATGRLDTRDPLHGAPSARVRRAREEGRVIVERRKPDGSFDWFTAHWTRWGARRAAARYLRDGKVVGRRP
jgi:hypothetical protein